MTCSCVWHDLFIYMTGPIHIRDKTHVYISHSYVCDLSCSWRTSRSRYRAVAQMTHLCVWHDAFMCVTWLIHVCDMTHLRITISNQGAFTRAHVPWLVHMYDMKYSNVHMCPVTHSYVWHDSFTCVPRLLHSWVHHTTHLYSNEIPKKKMIIVKIGNLTYTLPPASFIHKCRRCLIST